MKPITDLSSLDTAASGEEGATLHVRHPVNGEPMYVVPPGAKEPVKLTVTVLGSDSPTWRNKVADINRRRLREMRGRKSVSPEQIDGDALDLLAVCTVAWTGVVLDGQALACTPETATTVYRRLPWLREQADEFANSRENFAGEPARN
jgi:hypothetical protein